MSKGKHDQVDMLHGPLLGKLILFALPLALSSILQQLFNAVDIAVLGQFATSQDQAAVGCTSAVINMFLNLFLGISVGANVVIATYIGQRDKEKVQASVHTAMLIALISGFVMMLVGFVTARPILELIQTPESVLDKAVLYLLIYFAGMPFVMVYNFGAAILRSVGDTKRPLICLTVSGVLNAGLNIFLVAVCGMDVDGVAIATVLSNVVSCVVVVWMLCREKSEIRLSWRARRGAHPAVPGSALHHHRPGAGDQLDEKVPEHRPAGRPAEHGLHLLQRVYPVDAQLVRHGGRGRFVRGAQL